MPAFVPEFLYLNEAIFTMNSYQIYLVNSFSGAVHILPFLRLDTLIVRFFDCVLSVDSV